MSLVACVRSRHDMMQSMLVRGRKKNERKEEDEEEEDEREKEEGK